jgi:hypothetical protein
MHQSLKALRNHTNTPLHFGSEDRSLTWHGTSSLKKLHVYHFSKGRPHTTLRGLETFNVDETYIMQMLR